MQSAKEQLWVVAKEGKVCGEYASRQQAEAGLRQLAKLYPSGTALRVQYIGKNVHHCTRGGEPLG